MSTVRKRVGRSSTALAVAVTYVVLGALLVFGPWGWSLNRATVQLYVFFRSDVPIAPAAMLPEHYGVLLNVLLFVPLGACFALLGRWSWWWVVLVAAITSGAIETAQGLWLDREASWSDVVSNLAGALLGALGLSLLARARQRPRSRSGPGRRR